MFSAIGTEARLRIMQLLMTAEPDGLVVGDIQSELEIPNSTLSHHLDKLKNEGLMTVRREGTFLWYRANTDDRRRAGISRSGRHRSVDVIAPLVKDKFIRAFVRAQKPAAAAACCGPNCCAN